MRHHRHRDAFQTGGSARRDPRLRVRNRPNPVEWTWYAFGGGLSPQLSQWVLRDTTGPTWCLRHICRALLQMAPFILAVVLFLPGPLNVRMYTALLGLLTGMMWSIAMMWGRTEHRLIKAGFAPGDAEQARHERADARHQRRRLR
jgi:Family of unknown function (DUF5313)